MATTTQNGGNALPPKPWEREGSSSRQAPFKPSSPGKTSDVVEASGTTRPGETVFNSDRSNSVNTNAPVRPLPTRPWENNYGRSSYGGMYNSYGGGVGGMYGGGMYGRGIYGGGMYNRGGYGGHYGSGMYGGGGMYNNGFGGPYGVQDSNDPHGEPTSPPGVWISFLRVMQGMVNFFGRISILIDQNTQAFHMLMSALLQLFDRSGMLYGELARFVLGVMGVKAKTKKAPPTGPNGLLSPGQHAQADQRCIEEAKTATSGSWDNVWGNEASR